MPVSKVDRKLNLVIPIYSDAEVAKKDAKPTAYVHSTPIDTETFDKYWEPIGIAFSRLYNGGLGVTAGARVADKMLRKVATELGVWDGPDGVQAGLVATIHQRTNVACVGKNGWELMTWYDAKASGTISATDAAVVEAAITFFTLTSSMHRRAELGVVMGLASALWGLQIESLDCTGFINSLRTATMKESIGETVVPLSPKSSTG